MIPVGTRNGASIAGVDPIVETQQKRMHSARATPVLAASCRPFGEMSCIYFTNSKKVVIILAFTGSIGTLFSGFSNHRQRKPARTALTRLIYSPPDVFFPVHHAHWADTILTYILMKDLTSRARHLLMSGVLGLVCLALFPALAQAQTARVQFIQNSPDPDNRLVDVLVQNALLLDDFIFRSASPYLTLPAGDAVQIDIGTSDGSSTLLSTTASLEGGRSYIIMLQGVNNTFNFLPNPEGRPNLLSLLITEAKQNAQLPNQIEFSFINGIPDSPQINAGVAGEPALATGVGYGDVTEYVADPSLIFTMQVARTSAPSYYQGLFDLNIGFLRGKAVTVITSGFINRFGNANGEGMALMVVPPDGITGNETNLISTLPLQNSERFSTLQLINNAPDVTHRDFDITLDGGVAVDSLRFRTAATIQVEAGATLDVGVADGETGAIYAQETITFAPNQRYIIMVNGVVDPSIYAPNPSGINTALSMTVRDNARGTSTNPNVGQYVFFNGIPDLPPIDLAIEQEGIPVENLQFGGVTEYLDVAQMNDVVLEVFRGGVQYPALFRHGLDWPFVLGRSFVLFASGFNNPAMNQNGAGTKLQLATADGFVVDIPDFEKPGLEEPRLQLIHASPDPVAETVDIYIGNTLLLDDANYRSASGFFPVPSRPLTFGIAPSNSSSVADVIATLPLPIQQRSDSLYVGVIAGVLNENFFAPNPDGRPITLSLFAKKAREDVETPNQVELLPFNGITDARTSNIMTIDNMLLGENVGFGGFGEYTPLDATNQVIDYQAINGSGRVARTSALLEGLNSLPGVLVGTGFINPGANQNGPDYNSFLVLTNGSIINFGFHTVDNETETPLTVTDFALHGNYPNPFRPETQVLFDLPEPAQVALDVYDVTGRKVLALPPRTVPAGADQTLTVKAGTLAAGLYLYQLRAETPSRTFTDTGRMVVVK